ncbi:MAG: hypothetical protein DRP68_03515 [Candidatus Omnitrophota bacterium]|nr:MAG: hypothetical protein DRP68_03515 [Candidatus Omnitrophota bacterium]RKY38718.1 MAG: hypothetical protein DRP72_01290 [Candidatus Omnitrophota bacterium]
MSIHKFPEVFPFSQLSGKDLKIFKFLPQKVLENIRVPKFWGNNFSIFNFLILMLNRIIIKFWGLQINSNFFQSLQR